MAKSRLFGGVNLGEIAQSVKDRAQPSPFESGSRAQPVVPAAELALTGRVAPPLERENVFLVDPKRVRAWKHHNRTGGLVHARALRGPDRFDCQGWTAGAGGGPAPGRGPGL